MTRWVALLSIAFGLSFLLPGEAAEPVSLAYVFNVGSQDVTIINTATNAKIATRRLGAAVKWISNEQQFFDGQLVWTYEDQPDGSLDVIAIDLQKVEVVRRTHVGRGPGHSVVLTPDRHRAIVNAAGENKLVIIDTRSGRVVQEVPVGKFPCDLHRTHDGRVAFVPERDQDTVAAIDLQTLQVIKRVHLGAGAHPHMLRVSPDGRFVWVQNAHANTNVILDAKTLDQVAVLPVGKTPVTNAFTPDGRFGWISHAQDNFISVVDAQTFKEVNRIKVAQGLAVLAFRPDGKFAYVAAREAHAVGVIDVERQKLIKLIPAGQNPWGIITMPAPK